MTKHAHKFTKIAALLLCVLTVLPMFAGCEEPLDATNKGSYITMYLSDSVIDLDPANCYINDASMAICSLLYDTLFKLDKNGKVQKNLVKDYSIEESNRYGECVLTLTLNRTTWSNGNAAVRADDIVYAWKRILKSSSNNEAAALLYDIKNARAAKAGDCSIDDVGIYAVEDYVLEIMFDEPIDFDRFFLNLTSVALAPVLESSVKQGEDWAKKSSTLVTSGPFKLSKTSIINVETLLIDAETIIRNNTNDIAKAQAEIEKAKAMEDQAAAATVIATQEASIERLNNEIKKAQARIEKYSGVTYEWYPDVKAGGKDFSETYVKFMVLERNPNYYRNNKDTKEKLDSTVTPYRIVVECDLSDEELAQKVDDGEIYYLTDIPLSLRAQYKDKANVSDDMSTFSYFLNENALIKNTKTGEDVKLFADKNVRKAMSLALDRQTIADTVVFAKPAAGIVPNGVFDAGSAKKTFRSAAGKLIDAGADVSAAKSLLSSAGINPADYAFEITVAAYDAVNAAIAAEAQKAWQALGFSVTLKRLGFITNNDYSTATDSTPNDVIDDLFAEAYRNNNYQVIGVDLRALTVDAFSVLAPFATEFSGQPLDMSDIDNIIFGTHRTGYSSEAYDALIEAAMLATGKERTNLLHQAEEMLTEDMPVIPVVANQYAFIRNKNLTGVGKGDYYAPIEFTKSQIKNWQDFLLLAE